MKDPLKILNSTQVERVFEDNYPTISPSDLATKARKVIRSSEVRTLPVIENRKLHGILSARDLLKITSTHSNLEVSGIMKPANLTGTPEWTLDKIVRKFLEFDIYDIPLIKGADDKTYLGMIRLERILEEILGYCEQETKIKEIMTRDVITTEPEETISKVWTKMEESNISGFPVVKDSKPIGMITRLDVIKSGRSRLSEESKKGRDPPKVKTIMTSPAITISPQDSIKDTLEIMIKRKIGRLPVTENERLIGIIDREDIIGLYV